MKEDAKASKDNEDAFYNSQKFEVLYCGRVTVTHKKAPSSLIDDCIEKFSLHEQQRLKSQGEQRGGTEAGDDPAVFEAPAAEALSEEGDGVPATQPAFPSSAAGQPGLPSSRVGFPERILEDSGFDEQQEFRSRCSSVTGVLQRKVHENSQKPQPRRRHASAPSHVQPSDSEKNRTMLFQVPPRWGGGQAGVGGGEQAGGEGACRGGGGGHAGVGAGGVQAGMEGRGQTGVGGGEHAGVRGHAGVGGGGRAGGDGGGRRAGGGWEGGSVLQRRLRAPPRSTLCAGPASTLPWEPRGQVEKRAKAGRTGL